MVVHSSVRPQRQPVRRHRQFFGLAEQAALPVPQLHLRRYGGPRLPQPDPELAAKFLNCRFTDDPSLSPRNMLYFHHEGGGPVVNLAVSDNALFQGCTFELKHEGVLPWSWRATYQDCTMSQASTKQKGMPKGKYLGRTVINAPVDLYNSKIQGTVILNGERLPQGLFGGEPW